MDSRHLDLAHEFPELQQKIHDFKMNNNHFKRLYDEYSVLNKAIYNSETRASLMSEIEEEKLRKQRLALKDESLLI